MLSVVLPAYNEEKMIAAAAEAIGGVLRAEGIDCELLFVDDGSSDGTWEEILRAADRDDRVAGVRFSRNFGKEAAIFAGLEYARGDCVAVMDCDLQHPPETLPEMYTLWTQGAQVVEGVKEDRGRESAAHRLSARLFYGLISAMSGFDMENSSDFKLLDRAAVNALLAMPERSTFFRALSHWVGFRTAQVRYTVRERAAGESKWSTRSLIRYAVNNITAFSSAPLQLVTLLGSLFLVLAVVLGVIALVQKIRGTALGGFTTVILVQLFSSSIVMISLGIVGKYISKIYEESKRRPRYIVSALRRAPEKEKPHA